MRFKLTLSILLLSYFAPIKSSALVNGLPVINQPDLVRLVFKDQTMCTGAFIDEFTILTSAHCLVKSTVEKIHELDKVLSSDDILLPSKQLTNIIHPKYDHDWWPSFDLGIIKTSRNTHFQKDFKFRPMTIPLIGNVRIYGCGISRFEPKARERSQGLNSYFKLGEVLIFFGRLNSKELGKGSSIAPNDSGAPVVTDNDGNLIAVAAQSTAKESVRYGLPIISAATSVLSKENLKFILENMGEKKINP